MYSATRREFNAYLHQQAEFNSGENAGQQPAVLPSAEQRLENKVCASSNFLQSINIHGVSKQKGEKLGRHIELTLSEIGDKNTEGQLHADRTIMAKDWYHCQQTKFATHIEYATLNLWAKSPDFQVRLCRAATWQIAHDRMMIGFNPERGTAVSDLTADPLQQEMNIGWLQHLRQQRAEAVVSNIRVGQGGDYASIDEAVLDAASELITRWYQDDPDLLVIIGHELLPDQQFTLPEQQQRVAADKFNNLDISFSNLQIGGLNAIRVPFFPTRSFIITCLDNLSIYYQQGSHRRKIIDNPKRRRIEDLQSINQAYVIEDYDLICLVENILIPDGSGGWQ